MIHKSYFNSSVGVWLLYMKLTVYVTTEDETYR